MQTIFKKKFLNSVTRIDNTIDAIFKTKFQHNEHTKPNTGTRINQKRFLNILN